MPVNCFESRPLLFEARMTGCFHFCLHQMAYLVVSPPIQKKVKQTTFYPHEPGRLAYFLVCQ